MAPVPTTAEDLQAAIRDHLESVDRTGDVDRIAQRIALRHSRGSRLVGVRRGGREVYLHEDCRSSGRNALAIYEVGRDGQLTRTGTVWRGRELGAWLREHRYFFEWIAPGLR